MDSQRLTAQLLKLINRTGNISPKECKSVLAATIKQIDALGGRVRASEDVENALQALIAALAMIENADDCQLRTVLRRTATMVRYINELDDLSRRLCLQENSII